MRIKYISTRIWPYFGGFCINPTSFNHIYSPSLKSFYFDEKIQDLLARSKFISNYIDDNNISNLKFLMRHKNIENDTNTRITIIDYDGNVLGDSDKIL